MICLAQNISTNEPHVQRQSSSLESIEIESFATKWAADSHRHRRWLERWRCCCRHRDTRRPYRTPAHSWRWGPPPLALDCTEGSLRFDRLCRQTANWHRSQLIYAHNPYGQTADLRPRRSFPWSRLAYWWLCCIRAPCPPFRWLCCWLGAQWSYYTIAFKLILKLTQCKWVHKYT